MMLINGTRFGMGMDGGTGFLDMDGGSGGLMNVDGADADGVWKGKVQKGQINGIHVWSRTTDSELASME